MKLLVYAFLFIAAAVLVIGLVVVNLLQPGVDFQPSGKNDVAKVQTFVEQAHTRTTDKFLLDIIPTTYLSAFTGDNLLQVLLVSILTAFAIASLGSKGRPILNVIEHASPMFFASVVPAVQ